LQLIKPIITIAGKLYSQNARICSKKTCQSSNISLHTNRTSGLPDFKN